MRLECELEVKELKRQFQKQRAVMQDQLDAAKAAAEGTIGESVLRQQLEDLQQEVILLKDMLQKTSSKLHIKLEEKDELLRTKIDELEVLQREVTDLKNSAAVQRVAFVAETPTSEARRRVLLFFHLAI